MSNEMERYYAANNYFGSQSSAGFDTTWFVLEFDSKSARDEYVAKRVEVSARKIKRSEITNYIGDAKPFIGKIAL